MSKTKKDRPIAVLTVRVRDASKRTNVGTLNNLASWGRSVTARVARNPEKYADTFRARFYG